MRTLAAQVATDIDAPLASTWEALTNPNVLGKAFFGSQVETTWKVGSPICFRGDWKGKPFEDKGKVLAVSAKKQLRFSHFSGLSGLEDRPENYHVVTFDLVAAGAGTNLRLTQENQDDKPVDEAAKLELAKNWTGVLEALRKETEKTYGGRSD